MALTVDQWSDGSIPTSRAARDARVADCSARTAKAALLWLRQFRDLLSTMTAISWQWHRFLAPILRARKTGLLSATTTGGGSMTASRQRRALSPSSRLSAAAQMVKVRVPPLVAVPL